MCYNPAMKTLMAIYKLFILLVIAFFVVTAYQYNLIAPFINQVVILAQQVKGIF
jgi:hypothetical protein